MSQSWEQLPSIYRSKQDFLASLPLWRRLLQKLNWHPTIDKKVQRYALEQRILQMRKENERLRQERLRSKRLDAQIEALFCSDGSCSSPTTPTDDGSTPS